jgi:hypothetical protein
MDVPAGRQEALPEDLSSMAFIPEIDHMVKGDTIASAFLSNGLVIKNGRFLVQADMRYRVRLAEVHDQAVDVVLRAYDNAQPVHFHILHRS